MEIEKNKFKTKNMTISSLVIAMYVIIMILTQSFAFGAVQVRIATSLYAFAYLCPFLVLPLGAANIISNMLLGGLGFFVILGGGLVGIITSLLVYAVIIFNLKLPLIMIPIVFIPGLIVPIWLSGLTGVPYKVLAVSLCLGQMIPAIVGFLLVVSLKDKIGEK